MASIRQRQKADGSTVFHVQVRQAGFPARSASFPTRRMAERWAKTIEAQMIEGRHFRHSESRRRTVAEAIDRYVAEEIPKKRDGSMHRVRLPWWKKQIGNVKLADVTPALLAEMREKLKAEPYVRAKSSSKRTTVPAGQKATEYRRADGTVNRFLAVLSHVFTIARKEWHWAEHNPFDGVSKLRESRGRVRCLDAKERAALLLETSKDPTLHTFVMLALTTACRAGELLKLTWRDVDLKEGRLLFQQTKNDEPRTAWLHGDALRMLTEHAKVRPIDTARRVFQGASEKGAYDYATAFKEAVIAASLRDFRFHDLRHSAATYLAQGGATEAQLRAIGGWKSGVVRKYVHLAAADAKAALQRLSDKIDGKNPPDDAAEAEIS